MYARFLCFKSDSGNRPSVEALANQAYGIMKNLQGFISVHFVISGAEDEYGSFSLWETKEEAMAAGDSIRADVGTAMQNLTNGIPKIEIYEVYKPQ